MFEEAYCIYLNELIVCNHIAVVVEIEAVSRVLVQDKQK